MKRLAVLLAHCCQLPTAPSFRGQLPRFLTDSLDAYVARGLREWQIPGCAVAVVKDRNLVLAKGYGLREWGKPDRVDENTLFLIGSNTKAFTATALAMLEADGNLSLNDPVRKQRRLPDGGRGGARGGRHQLGEFHSGTDFQTPPHEPRPGAVRRNALRRQ